MEGDQISMECDISEQQDSVALTRSERSDLGSKRSSFLEIELSSPLLLLLFTLEALE